MKKKEELMLDVGQANELKLAFRRAGWTNADITSLCRGDNLEKMLPFLRGYAQLPDMNWPTIDCSVPPRVGDGWKIAPRQTKYRFSGELKLDAQSQDAVDPLVIPYDEFGDKNFSDLVRRAHRKQARVLPANVADFLVENTQWIPNAWRRNFGTILFLGTLYQTSNGSFYGVKSLTLECYDESLARWGTTGFAEYKWETSMTSLPLKYCPGPKKWLIAQTASE